MSSHFTKQPDALSVTADDRGLVRVHGSGFLTREILATTVREHASSAIPRRLLVDLRDVIGYERACGRIARALVEHARRGGVQRIAIVASSAVLRTSTRVLASRTGIALRAFEHPATARRWLDHQGTGPVRSLDSSSISVV